MHRALGPGFLEKIYQEALCLELDARGLRFERERAIAVHYRGQAIPGQRIALNFNCRTMKEGLKRIVV